MDPLTCAHSSTGELGEKGWGTVEKARKTALISAPLWILDRRGRKIECMYTGIT